MGHVYFDNNLLAVGLLLAYDVVTAQIAYFQFFCCKLFFALKAFSGKKIGIKNDFFDIGYRLRVVKQIKLKRFQLAFMTLAHFDVV